MKPLLRHTLMNLLALSITTTAMAQAPKIAFISVGYDDVNTGRDLSLAVHKPARDGLQFYVGIKFMPNSNNYKLFVRHYSPYFKQFEAANFAEHWGLKFGLEKKLCRSQRGNALWFFTDVRFTRGTVRSGNYYWQPDTVLNNYCVYSKILASSCTFGLNGVFPLGKKIALGVQAGLGINVYSKAYAGQAGVKWCFTRLAGISLRYDLSHAQNASTFSANSLHAKNALMLSFNNVHSGRNLNLTFRKSVGKKDIIYAGAKYNINSFFFQDVARMGTCYYFKQFRATGSQHLGLLAGWEHKLVQRNKFIFYGFAETQYAKMDLENLASVAYFSYGSGATDNPAGNLIRFWRGERYDQSTEFQMYAPSFRYCRSVGVLEHYAGLGFSVPVSERLSLDMRAGLGVNVYFGAKYFEPYTVRTWYSETVKSHERFDAPPTSFSKMFSVGLTHAL